MIKIFSLALQQGVVCLTCLIFSYSVVKAQAPSVPTIIQPSPTAASLGKYGDIPVGYHTGTANVSVPLYEVKEGPVTVPISLNYHTSGIRVAEASSWVGLGWALNCGGVITRTVQHVPDEGPLRVTVPDGILSAEFVVSSGYYTDGYILPEHLTFGSYDGGGFADPDEWLAYRKYISAAAADLDSEPDIFFYNFGSYSGKFFFKVEKDAQGNLIRTPVFIPKADVKIDVTFGPTAVPTRDSNVTETRNTFTGFVLTTPDGFKYHFGGNNAIEYSGTESNNTSNYQYNALVKLAPSSWYLTKVESPDGHFITLEYAPDKYSFFDIGGERCWSGSQYLDLTSQTVMRTVISGLQLSRIASSNEEVLFQANTVRQDLSDYDNDGGGEVGFTNITTKMLDRIVVKKLGGENTKVFDFHHSYFECSDNFLPFFLEHDPVDRALFVTDTKRLRLDSVVEKSGDLSIINPGHAFTYRDTSASGSPRQLPRRLSFQQDHWGYFNGKSGNKSLIAFYADPRNANRDTDDDYSNIGVLTSIKYPTGGKSVFEYESNSSYGLIDDHVNNASTNYGASASFFSADPSEVITPFSVKRGIPTPGSACAVMGLGCDAVEASISLYAGDPRVPNNYDLDYSAYAGQLIAGIYKADGTIVRGFFVGELGDINTANCQSPSCSGFDGRDTNVLTCEQPNPSRTNNYMHLGRDHVNVDLPPGDYYVRALRIDGPKVNCPAKNVLFTATVSINLSADRDPDYQEPHHYGMIKIGGLRIKKITNVDRSNKLSERTFTYPATGGVLFGKPTYFYQIERVGAPPWANAGYFNFFDTQLWGSSSIIAMQSTQGSHLGYETVEEHQTGNGFSRYTYDVATHPYDFQIPQDPYYAGNFSNYTSTDRYYNYPPYPVPLLLERGNLLKEEQYSEQLSLVHKKENIYETGHYEISTHAAKVEFIYGSLNPNPQPGQDAKMGDLPTYTNYPIYTGTTRLLTETETTYTTGGAPVSVVTEYKYESPKHLQTTEVKKNLSTRQEVVKMIYPPDYGTMTTSVAGIQNLQQINMINIPLEQYKIRQGLAGENPVVTEGAITTFMETAPLRDVVKSLSISSPIPISSFSPSNDIANEFQADSRYEDRMTFNHYGSFGNVEEVSKSKDVHISYIWGYNNSFPIAEIKNANRNQVLHTSFEDATANFSAEAKTGSKSSNVAYNVVLPSAGTYQLTYWKKVGGNSWTLVQSTVSADTNIGGTGILVDEVRLYPAGAQMTTYTYDTSAGITTMTDPNNIVTHYYYDSFKRLQYVTDDKGNVLKTLNYHYRNQSGN